MENQDPLAEAYLFYEKYAKPAIVNLQSEHDEIPMEFLLEIYSAFDHLKRFYINDEDKNKVAKEVINHLKRSALDCYKTYLVLFNKELSEIENNYDLTLLDNGYYYPKFLARKYDIHKNAATARSAYPNFTTEQEFELWNNVYKLIFDFKKEMIEDYKDNLGWAKKKSKIRRVKGYLISFLLGFLSSALVSLLL